MSNEIMVFENEEFGQVRSIIINGEPWFVGRDVAGALGYKDGKAAVRDLVDGVDKQLIQKGQYAPLDIPNRGLTFINESGLYSLILSSELPRAKAFKRWVTSEVLPSIRKTGKYEIKQQVKIEQSYPVADMMRDIRDTKSVMLELGVSDGIAMAKAISLVEKYNQFDLSEVKSLIPPTTDETGYLTPTKIGEQIGLSIRKVNKLLESQGFQYKECDEWHLTGKGKQYGEKFPYENNGHSGYQIRWHKEIVDLLK